MIDSYQYLEDQIFQIHNEEEFNRVALEVFNYQYQNSNIYRNFVDHLSINQPKHFTAIPFLPISFFKTHTIQTIDVPAKLTFLSSGTTGSDRSSHLVNKPELYVKSFTKTYENFIGNPKDQVIIGLLPNYLEQGNSSLVYMVNHLINATQSPLSQFVLHDLRKIHDLYLESLIQKKKVVIIGVSYALLDLAEINLNFSEAIIIETGGMKGRRNEFSKEILHEKLKKGLKTKKIYSEYGMTELLSQCYSIQNGLFTEPPWMKVLIREINDPFHIVENGKTGGINIIDLANLYSCSFICTQDLGKRQSNFFKIIGRFDYADQRGCNLMVE